ncbi:crotonase/enoyl-CoA hydratase family protein [Streptodolium elevatio]|uniref:Crotonase/enoyl-CoA hydratase family protein n=1 Tax=Streptodolium elevatio TaxID=3157996 RepID=A0ABV3DMD3_9ACTN
MGALVTYRLEDAVATVTLDDGKVNALSPGMLAEIGAALDRAEADGAVVVLTGRERVFSAGFDLRVLRGGGAEAYGMLMAGFELAVRMLAFPRPVVVACNGHAYAMAVFLLLSGDYRVGVDGPYTITANEVAIGLTMPHTAVEVCRQRLTPAHFTRAVVNAEAYSPADAVPAGFLDRVVADEELAVTARAKAVELAKLDPQAHAASKLRVRGPALAAIREAIEKDAVDLRASG